MTEIKFTKTATFIFPLLQIPKNLFEVSVLDKYGRNIYSNRFINAYLEDQNVTSFQDDVENNYIFLLLKNYQDVNFSTFYSTITAFPNYVDDYDIKDCLVMVFRIPEETKEDYDLLINGKYSEISTESKKLILGNNFYSGKAFTLPLILNKSSALKESWEDKLSFIGPHIYSPADLGDQEVWPIINREKEVLTKEIIDSFIIKKDLQPI